LDGGKFLYQFLKVVTGFIVAVLFCGLFFAWGYFRSGSPEVDPIGFASTIGAGLVTASVVGGAALVPVAVLIGVAEAARLRGLVFHVGAAGALAFVAWTLGGEAGSTAVRPGSAVALAAGFIAGGLYWLIAGRSSGCWHGLHRQPPTGRKRGSEDQARK